MAVLRPVLKYFKHPLNENPPANQGIFFMMI